MLSIVILAAGKGTRMNSQHPKVLQTIGGRPMLTHVLDTAKRLDADKTIVVIGHGGDAIQAHYQDRSDLTFVWQTPQLGTGHAVQQAQNYLLPKGYTLVLYGDVPLISDATLRRLINTTQAAGDTAMGVLTIELDNAKGYGRIVRNPAGQITRIVEDKDASEQEQNIKEINTGIVLVPSAALKEYLGKLSNNNAQGEYYLTDIIALSVQAQRPVVGVFADSEWEVSGVNNRAQQCVLEKHYQHHLADQLLTQGVQLMDKHRIDIRGELICGRDVVIDVGCIFSGRVELGDGVYVGPYSVISDATIAADTQIQAYSHIAQSTVGQNARIGPFARLRPGTTLANDVHIGNFVELKNTQMGTGSKANHLAYVGDATVGSKVNIGAGVITVNYDGVNKYRTTIEDGAFIGSDSQLIAPVTVGKMATIGAGTTLTKDAPADQLTVGRSKAVSLAGWKRPTKSQG